MLNKSLICDQTKRTYVINELISLSFGYGFRSTPDILRPLLYIILNNDSKINKIDILGSAVCMDLGFVRSYYFVTHFVTNALDRCFVGHVNKGEKP